MAVVDYKSDISRSLEQAEGSDGRLNVSSRSDGRRYYNSRDLKRSFTAVFDHQSAAAGEYSAYWQNTSTSRDLVISSVGLNVVENARIKLWFVTGTAGGGATMTPVNMNYTSSKAAEATALQGQSGSGISGLTAAGVIDFAFVTANGHEEFRLEDSIRLGQNDAIAIEYDEGTTGDFGGVIFGYYEETRQG